MPRAVLIVVDDDEDMRMITRKTIQRTPHGDDFHIVEAATASSAGALFARHHEVGDLVHMVCDHGLPDGSGVDLFTTLVDRDLGFQERFLLITSSIWTIDGSAATAAGIEHIVEKPFGMQAWRELLGSWVSRWGAALPAEQRGHPDAVAHHKGDRSTSRS